MLTNEDYAAVVEATRFGLTTQRSGPDIYVVGVEGELDLYRTPALKDLFLDLVGRGARAVVIDLEAASFLDSTALALLLTMPRQIGPRGKVIVACDNPQINKTFQITGTDRRLTLMPDVRHAFEHLEAALTAD